MSRTLAARFGNNVNIFRSNNPLNDDQIMRVAPSIFAQEKHDSRSERYTYIPTIDVLNGLRGEGFFPFMVCQSRSRIEGKSDFTKHMIRLRQSGQIDVAEANEIILINSHDGTSSYQMVAGLFRFVCHNGLVCGNVGNDIRIPHRGNVVDNVIEGAFRVLDDFEIAREQRENMQHLTLNSHEQNAFARAALMLKYDDPEKSAPITESQILQPRRWDDRQSDLWHTYNRVQENMIKGGLRGRNANGQRSTTRAVSGIDQNVKINRALWVLGQEMARLKGVEMPHAA